MHYLLAAVLFFGILTLWVPAYWPVAVFESSILALAICAVFRWTRAPRRFTYPLAPLLFCVSWGALQWSAGWSVSAFETRIALARWTTMLAVFLTGWVVFQDPRIHRWFRMAMLWFGSLIAMLATLQTFTAGGKIFWMFHSDYAGRVMGPILSPNHYAAFVEVILPLAVYESLRRTRDALLYAALAAVLFASVVVSASRAGVAIAAAEFLLVILLLWMRGASGRVVGMALLRVAVLLAAFTAVVGWGKLWHRLQITDTFAFRREFAISTLRMIADRPWLGSGLGTWPIVYPAYAIFDPGTYANRAHNDWLEWTAEGGLPFGLAMATVFIWCLRPALRSVWGIGVVAVLLHAAVDYPFSRAALAAWIVVMLALLACAPEEQSIE